MISRTLKRTRVTLLVTGLFYLCAGLLMVSRLPLMVDDTLPKTNAFRVFLLITGIVVIVLILFSLRYGIAYTYRAIKWWNIEQSPVYLLLKKHPEDVVWIYDGTTQGTVELFHRLQNQNAVVIRLSDGSKYQLYSSSVFVLQLIEFLSHAAPQARVGYQAEWEKEYKQNPSQFKAIPVSEEQIKRLGE
jgi:hypothetical protein